MKRTFFILFISTLLLSCSSDDTPRIPSDLQDQDFVWKAMNYWYFWQADVSSLADTQDDNEQEYFDYLGSFNDGNTLFESLIYVEDDFSWFIPDVDEQLAQFRGVSVSYGIEIPRSVFSVNQQASDVYIYIRYVVPGSPAANAGLERGDLIYRVNGEVLNGSNFQVLNDLIFVDEGESISLGVGTLVNGSIQPKGSDVTLNAAAVNENPVHFSSIIQEGGKNIGYLVYNGFRNTYNSELNNAFETFKNQGVDELILDLRYNRGGSVLTSSYLASMIAGNQPDGATFARLKYNAKRDPSNGAIYPFDNEAAIFDKVTGEYTGNTEVINRLTSLTHLYIITSGSTASASEMIINGLNPSMNVVLVGLKTTGKNEGSITLVDAPAGGNFEAFQNINGRRSNIGLQPITFQVFNSLDQSDYAEGFDPDFSIDEDNFANNILPFGNTNEALLRATLDVLSGGIPRANIKTGSSLKVYSAELKDRKLAKDMFILPEEQELLK